MNPRDLIIGHAGWSGAAALIPIPFVDDLFSASVRKALLARLGKHRKAEIDKAALEKLGGALSGRKLVSLLGARRLIGKWSVPLQVLMRSSDIIGTFQLGTLFDHHLRTRDENAGPVDVAEAGHLLRAVEVATKSARGEATERAFMGILKQSSSMALAVPRQVRAIAAKYTTRKKSRAPELLVKTVPKPIVAQAIGFMGSRASTVERSYVELLRDAFDRSWRTK